MHVCTKKHSMVGTAGFAAGRRRQHARYDQADRTQARTVVRELSNGRAMGLAEEATRGTQRRPVDDSRARGGSMSRGNCAT
ncbi:hypothetical protein GT037_005916 [Alternaria burnsii]|uniref:Uncharacterized protein n=1 Tax=Alternaria burnsii TaxID=1187904 RepID=A0A8H7B780_9PLEO|nr:uncharacterized protein GT037_005916 [Alternaria burnsii]KAF7676411.1 hypothetical protein GT037_005916 [Alternaria burnsii]